MNNTFKSIMLVAYSVNLAHLSDWYWLFILAIPAWSVVLVMDVVRDYREYRHTKIRKENEERMYAAWPARARPPWINSKSD